MQQANDGMAGARQVADALVAARRTGRAADAAPLDKALVGPDDAYAAQALVAEALGWHPGGVARAWKSGGASRPAVLTHAGLPEDGVVASPGDLRGRPFHMRMIEAEVALRLGRAVTPAQAETLTNAQAPALLDGMTVSIEVVDSRWQQAGQAPALLKLADLQTHGALVLGTWQPFAARDWSQQVCRVAIGNAAPKEFRGTHSLDDPAWLLPIWLRHVTRNGATVPAGTVVTTGTWCGLLAAQAGDRVQVVFEGLGEASVQL